MADAPTLTGSRDLAVRDLISREQKTHAFTGLFGGLVDMRATIVENATKMRGISRKALLFAAKEAGFLTAEWWFKTYAPKHFTPRAVFDYGPYRKYYRNLRKRYLGSKKSLSAQVAEGERKPLVDTGYLRDKVLLTPIVRNQNLKGTSKKTTIMFRYGRPPDVEQKANIKVARLMDKYGLSRGKALAAAFANAGYSAKIKARFQELIPFVSESEAREMGKYYRRAFLEALTRFGRSGTDVPD